MKSRDRLIALFMGVFCFFVFGGTGWGFIEIWEMLKIPIVPFYLLLALYSIFLVFTILIAKREGRMCGRGHNFWKKDSNGQWYPSLRLFGRGFPGQITSSPKEDFAISDNEIMETQRALQELGFTAKLEVDVRDCRETREILTRQRCGGINNGK